VVAFDLTAAAAPALVQDRELLYVDQFSLGSKKYISDKAVEVASSDGQDLEFVAAVVPDGNRSMPPPGVPMTRFATEDVAGVLPSSIHVAPVPDGTDAGVLAVLVPGAQGIATIPVQGRLSYAALRTQLIDRLNLPGPSDDPLTLQATVEATAAGPAYESFPVPFQVQSSVPWLRPEQTEGTTPAEITLIVEPSGLPSGTHAASVKFTAEGATYSRKVTLTVGPELMTEGILGDLNAPIGQPFTHTFRLFSSSTPFDFTIEPRDPWIQASPISGTTPQEITVTFTPPGGFRAGEVLTATLAVLYEGRFSGLPLRYVFTSTKPIVLSDRLSGTTLAPGSIFYYHAGTSRCDAPQAESLPWPETLGGCTLRVNGRRVPLSGIAVEKTSGAAGWVYQPTHSIGAQLPYDLEAGLAEVELEDRDGRKTTLPLRIDPIAPVFRGTAGLGQLEHLVRHVGEELTLRLSGMGRMTPAAPVGDVPTQPVSPLAPIQAFIGGRRAAILAAELSPTEVGVLEVRVQVPPIAQDLHVLSLRVDGIDVSAGTITIAN
jgi:uncharacterized protein (TIGR03437 family)